MATTKGREGRPGLVHTSRSFTRMDPDPVPESPRKRASTFASSGIPAIPEAKHIATSPDIAGKHSDIFETHEEQVPEMDGTNTPGLHLPNTFDELPIEVRSMTERFLESLSMKIHPTPFTADALSELFQEFYIRAEAQIATHIASLASRIGRERPSPQGNTRSAIKGRTRAGSGAKRNESPSSGGEMLTASEVADRKKARRLLELKRVALEEAVERGVCEKIYDRIFKYKGTDDDARDEKLRSRTAALSLIGIGLKELHMDSDPTKEDMKKRAEEKEEDIHRSLASAREALQRMDEEHYPLGKLQHLTAAHKCIVETLAESFPSSSSADEILPTLIYTLITSPPEGINVVSNLSFIQRFRASNKVDGEAAYCLVNLEAAISFLETVDLSSLRADELPEGPPKASSQALTLSAVDKSPLAPMPLTDTHTLSPEVTSVTTTSELSASRTSAAEALPRPTTPITATARLRPDMQQRRLSSLMQAQADRLEAGRQDFLQTADRAFDSINNTLENSLKFVFGKFTEHAADSSPLPKTLEDARRLVSRSDEEDDLSISGRSSPGIEDYLGGAGKAGDSKLLELIGGSRAQLRDRSADSAKSGGSAKRVAFARPNSMDVSSKGPPKEEPQNAATNFITSMNPLNRFGVPGFARFGRTASQQNTPPQLASPPIEKAKQSGEILEPSGVLKKEDLPKLEKAISKESDATTDLNAAEALAELRSIQPPVRRFLEVRNAAELRIGEVEALLGEYRRLAKAIADAIAT